MKILALLILVLCISVVSVSSQAKEGASEFTPRNGFSGHSEGNGKIRLFFGKQRLFRVESHGYDQTGGSFRLDQTVTFQGQPKQERFWMLKTSRQNHAAGNYGRTPARNDYTKGLGNHAIRKSHWRDCCSIQCKLKF